MMGLQKTIIIGHLGRDPELKYSKDGKPYCKFSVAVSEKYGGEKTTEWLNCTAFGNTAEVCNEYLEKGRQVYIEGKVSAWAWMPLDGGEPRASLELIVHNVQFLGGSGEKKQRPKKQYRQPADPDPYGPGDGGSIDVAGDQTGEEDIPF